MDNYTVLVGQNNSGKTLLVQLVYGVSEKIGNLFDNDITNIVLKKGSNGIRNYIISKDNILDILYKIEESRIVPFEEIHDSGTKEVINLDYFLKEQQYGIFAYEYRSPVILKEGSKTTDILVCIVDDKNKKIYTTIFDVKSNISAFSDDLTRNNAVITAIKEVRDFIEQIRGELLHKNSFVIYYKDEGYTEQEIVGIATKNFEQEKFKAVANYIEQSLKKEEENVPMLVATKLKNTLRPYENMIQPLKNFSQRILEISGMKYELQVYLLEKISDTEYKITITFSSD